MAHQTKIQEIFVCCTKPFINIRYDYQRVNIQHIREKFSFYVDFQMSEIFEIDPVLQLVGSKRKRVSSHGLLVNINCHIYAFWR